MAHRGTEVLIGIERPSAASLFLIQRKDTHWIGSATGFIVEHEQPVLVTSRHVVWSKENQPDALTVTHNREGALGQYVEKDEPLYDSKGDPLWYEHPTLGPKVDVIALPLSDVRNVAMFPYDPWAQGPGLRAGVSDSLNIIGFPFGETGGAGLAVWTRGFVASEPQMDWRGLPAFLIDSRTRQGQSGSPVIGFARGGTVSMADGSTRTFTGGTTFEELFGVYSGRIQKESDLGTVWKPSALRELIAGKQRAMRPTDRP